VSNAAARSDATAPRVLLRDEGGDHVVFEVLSVTKTLIRVRSPYLFELGEELALRVERDGEVVDTTVKVRAHVGPAESRITELEPLDSTAEV
jgi:hypothetical protein